VAVLVLMGTHTFGLLVSVFAGLGAGLGGFQMSAQSLVLEFGSRRNLPMRIAIANSASELMAAIGALAGGLLIVAFSYVFVFWLAIAFQLGALAIVIFWVSEPRTRAA
jgi:predicted MFS family arabinose efflux permease